MTLPTSGQIDLSEVNVELGNSPTATISLGATAVRGLAGIPGGTIAMSNLWGRAALTHVTYANSGQYTYGASYGYAIDRNGGNLIVTIGVGANGPNASYLQLGGSLGPWNDVGRFTFTQSDINNRTIKFLSNQDGRCQVLRGASVTGHYGWWSFASTGTPNVDFSDGTVENFNWPVQASTAVRADSFNQVSFFWNPYWSAYGTGDNGSQVSLSNMNRAFGDLAGGNWVPSYNGSTWSTNYVPYHAFRVGF